MLRSSYLLCAIFFGVMLNFAPAAEAARRPAPKRDAWEQYCPWSRDKSVCVARRACTAEGPLSPRCAKYCTVNRRDVVCGEHYQPTLPRVYPNGYSPYPWANPGGGFCQNNPYNIACQHNFPFGYY